MAKRLAGFSLSAAVLATFGGLAPAVATESAVPGDDVQESINEAIQDLEDLEIWDAPEEVNRDFEQQEPEGQWEEQESEEEVEQFQRREAQADDATATDVEVSEMLGVLPYYSMHTAEIFANTTAGVNLATGNLVIGATQTELSSAGVPAMYTDHYNSRDTTSGSLGGTWRSGIGQDTGVRSVDGALRFRDGSGFNQYFTTDDEITYDSPAGLNASVERTDDDEFIIDYHRTGQQMHFNRGGYLMESTDRNGVGMSYSYEDRRVTEVQDPAGRVTEVEYDDAANTITYVLPDGEREILYTQDDDGVLESVAYIRGDGSSDPETIQQINYSYNSDGLLSALRAEFNHTTSEIGLEVAYDSSDRVSELTYQRFYPLDASGENLGADERTESFSYSDGATVVTDRNGEDSTINLDDQGRQLSAVDQLGRERSQEWSANSDVTSSTSGATGGGPAGDISIYEYDEAGNRTGVELPTGAGASAIYQIGDSCDNGGSGTAYQVKCSEDTEGNEATYDYDAAGNLLGVTNESGGVEGFSHTRETSDRSVCNGFTGFVCSTTNANGETTSYTYSDDGDLIEVDQPSLGTTTISYDSISRPTSVTGPDGVESSYRYYVGQNFGPVTITDGEETVTLDNTHDRLETAAPYTWSDSTWEDFYLTKRAPGRGVYGDPLMETFTDQTAASDPFNFIRVNNNDDRGTTTLMTSLFVEAGESPQISATENFTYDAASQMQYMTLPGAAAGDSCSADSPSTAGGDCVGFTYDSKGNPIEQVFPGGAIKETEYDASSRATRITVTDASDEVVFDVGYTYADADNTDRGLIQTKTSYVEEGVPAAAVTTYTYDSLNRLTAAEEVDADGATNASWEYTYDDAGNRTTAASSGDTGREAEDTSYTYDTDNLLATIDGDSVSHDEAGNLTSNPDTGLETNYGARQNAESFTLDGDTAEATIFGGSNDNRKLFDGQIEYRSALGLHRTADEQNPEEGVTYSRDPRGGGLIAATPTDADNPAAGADSTFYVTDHLGSVVVLLDNDGEKVGGYSYDPYGQERAITDGAAEENLFRYAGTQHDEASGLYKMGHRYYDPSTGRFTQPDPSGAESSQYLYAAGNPINYIDPTGLEAYSVGGVQICYYLCLEVSHQQSRSGDTSIYVGPRFGPEIGITGNVGGGDNYSTGFQADVGCSAAVGYGGWGSIASSSAGTDFSGGYQWGAGGGCSVGAGYSFSY
ncbi:hypothetical protein BG28_09210 [Nesterenkonia sp. AN1]|uniref:RHS repeat-associated core domain-containing protein n=1 Tax=Nesterenkonia sp. AN1 TaxID=652017 RepID=UPI0004459C06|nr:RHS repeat-associated core domain-containing protein [Nesterenkonia sp. AN1]EXF23918.1 hypothetical protein BG28_09210 [Nesterenkonia sp. AN1]